MWGSSEQSSRVDRLTTGDDMRRAIVWIVVVVLCCLAVVPVARAASTFAADLAVYRARNATTSEAARELTSFVAAERRFARTVKGTSGQYRTLLRAYRTALDQADDAVRRITRDQRTSDSLLADITKLAGARRTDAAWVILRRGLEGQERYLLTIARARTLADQCRKLHAQLVQAGT
jgi:hypothetical protein